MTHNTDFAQLLSRWYQKEARAFLADVASERIPQLDQELKRLQDLVGTLSDDLPICFLGTSGVGKSTLINAVVAGREVLLPAGGVGPLTAEATLVKYADERLFRVAYHAPTKLNKLLFALERAHEKELLRQGITPEGDAGGVEAPLSEEEREEAESASATPIDDQGMRPSQAPDKIGVLARQASHLIRGDQYAALDRGYALDRLRDCLSLAPRWKTQAIADDLPRIAKIQEVLTRARRNEGLSEVRAQDDKLGFGIELEQHAAGFLAPLIRTIEVGWDAQLLKSGVVLIDLPGLGVANDEFRRVTAHWIRRARAVVLVVDRSGMSEASADLLRTSGFLNSLLHESHDPEKLNVTLIVAVVKLDSTADDSRAKEKLTNPAHVRAWSAHFDEACDKAILMVREQMSTELQKVSELGGDSTRDERAIVIRRVLEGMQVHPVVAPEYRKFLADDEDERPRIKSAEQSRVPKLARAFQEVAQERIDRVDARIEFLARNVSERLRGALELTQARGEHESQNHQEQNRRIRKDLELFAAPLRAEIVNRQGEFREFLRSTVPLQIESRVDAASEAARNDIKKRLKVYRGYHWGTIRAAVRRGGVYEGSRLIDIPADLTLLFEDTIAIVWSKDILQALRTKTGAIGKEYVAVVGDLVEWGRRQGSDLDPKVLEAMHKDLQAEMTSVALVGREAIDELKATVKGELYQKLETRVRQRCQQFVKSGADRGQGVMTRMLEMLEELADLVVEAARPIARDVLTKHYREVEAEILSKFDKYRNPVDVALKELVGDADGDLKNEEVARQREIARRAKGLLSCMPLQANPPDGEVVL